MAELFIGLMSGTSVDGIDAALVDFQDHKAQLVEFDYTPFPAELKQRIQTLSSAHARVSLKDYGALDAELGALFAEAVSALLVKAKLPSTAIKAIGSHGLTVYHSPAQPWPFTLQIGDPNVIAERTRIRTVADFRRRDIAAGGQGAPLVPAFHQAVFSHAQEARAIVNIGGIANITVLPASGSGTVLGFDTGPGNTLMDFWIGQHHQKPYDADGAWAASGTPDKDLIERLKQDAYFQASPPKSTGKEYFSPDWLVEKLADSHYRPEDVQASLCYLTAVTIAEAIQQHAPQTQRALICGGGAHNRSLLQWLSQLLPCPVETTARYGIHPDHVEAMAFAWLARQTLTQQPGNLKEVTGASHDVVLGGIYPA